MAEESLDVVLEILSEYEVLTEKLFSQLDVHELVLDEFIQLRREKLFNRLEDIGLRDRYPSERIELTEDVAIKFEALKQILAIKTNAGMFDVLLEEAESLLQKNEKGN
ncbi:hypothetical protein [Paenilisteria rocourtiae]|uniref:Uncharacterized protein n=1 Tax=Listeria rocourtiae TaxID=647910 RepID=A0A4V3DPQ3_9LIST|nr:hypothetical protein [Listeria rocourtiae]EUJ47621.1 hypothetical protein PROCOU_08592 [Listeria rocourtiae FSL F6-920]TDR53176.1 hypothetical protein DFP96_105100 [Listeria rocourtiae]